MAAGTLIVGASQAGLQLAVSLRELGDTAPITLVGAEAHPPYQRPPLSKDYLARRIEAESLALRSPAFYTDHGIDLICGQRVDELSLYRDGCGGGYGRTDRGRELRFDRLALTTGAAPRRLTLPGADLDGVCYLRDLDDARRLRTRLAEARHVVVVGGGFVGLEAAAVARSCGLEVTVVEVADRLIARAVGPVVSDFFKAAHERRGTRVRLGTGVSAFQGNRGRVTAVVLADGSEMPADVVVVGVGMVPHTELAKQLGLECDGGIVVDRYARTSKRNVVAAGDCTVLPHPMTGEGRVRLESVNNAVTQAQIAAATLMGRFEVARSIPWFWSNQGDLRLQIAGLAQGFNQYVVRGRPDRERFSVLYYRNDQLLAADAINSPGDYMTARKALAMGKTIPPELAADADTPLKNFLPPL